MMHLEAIIERNKRPTPQPSRLSTLAAKEVQAGMVAQSYRINAVRPGDAPDPMPEAEAHPR